MSGFFVKQLIPKIRGALAYLYPGGLSDSNGHDSKHVKIGQELRKIAIDKFAWSSIAKALLSKANATE